MVKSVLVKLAAQLENALIALNDVGLVGEGEGTELGTSEGKPQSRSALDEANQIYQSRRARDQSFPHPQIFGEPAWDILLDLYIRQARGETVSVKSATIGSAASASTALRWLKVLEEEGLISSHGDASDSRRRLVSLTPEGFERMTRHLTEIAR
jgi:DNA-binding MarR family transcriptional regulator